MTHDSHDSHVLNFTRVSFGPVIGFLTMLYIVTQTDRSGYGVKLMIIYFLSGCDRYSA